MLTHGGHSQAILIDRGPTSAIDPGAHLQRLMRRRALLGADAVRLPAWTLFDAPTTVQRWIERP